LYSTDAISSQTGDAGQGTDAGQTSDAEQGSDAGDSGTPGDAGPGGPSLCDASHFVFCDGFENGFGAQAIARGGGATAVDSTHVYRGAFAFRASMPATTAGATVSALIEPGQAWPAHVFLRVFAFLPVPLTPLGAGLFNYVDAAGAGLVLFVPGNNPGLYVQSFNFPDAGLARSSTRAPLGSWFCAEMEVDTVAHVVNVWMNENALSDLSETLPVGNLSTLDTGLSYTAAPASPAYEAWYDELAVDTSRIGCAR
jgi:hypothetical protein